MLKPHSTHAKRKTFPDVRTVVKCRVTVSDGHLVVLPCADGDHRIISERGVEVGEEIVCHYAAGMSDAVCGAMASEDVAK